MILQDAVQYTVYKMEIPQTLIDSVENSKCEYRTLGKSGLRVSVPHSRVHVFWRQA